MIETVEQFERELARVKAKAEAGPLPDIEIWHGHFDDRYVVEGVYAEHGKIVIKTGY